MSTNKTFLVIGANGLIGSSVIREIDGQYPWTGTVFRRPLEGAAHLDITEAQQVKDIFSRVRPDYVLHCANYPGGVAGCEQKPHEAESFHFSGTQNLVEQCQAHDSKLIYISSECVFDGQKERYSEEDQKAPLSVYGRFKAQSEDWIQSHLENYCIVRTMFVFGWQPETKTPNAVMSAYFSLEKDQKVLVPVYRWGNPTYVGDLAEALVELCLSGKNGIFHVCGSTYINRYDWIVRTCRKLNWNTELIVPVHDNPRMGTQYPGKISLDSTKFRSIFKTQLNDLETSLEKLQYDYTSSMSKN